MTAPEPAWISAAEPPSEPKSKSKSKSKSHPALYLTRSFAADGRPVRATARVSALGWYRLFVNGHDLTGAALVPRWTPFDHYVEYQDYDVSEFLRAGENRLDVVVADGRFRGRNGAISRGEIYGDRIAGWVRLTIEHDDGTQQCIVSDERWSTTLGPILASDPKYGETVDLRISQPWQREPDPGASTVEILNEPRRLIAEEVARVREVTRLSPVSITRTPSGQQLVDFGQNASGVVRVRLSGRPGQTVTLTHSEVVGPDGEIDTSWTPAKTNGVSVSMVIH